MPSVALRGLSLASATCLALFLGCVDPDGTGSTTGTTLYAFDSAEGATKRVLVWDNLESLVSQTGDPSPTRSLTGAAFDNVKNLAWGGLCVDGNGNRIYLVSQTGKVVRVERIRSQSGAITSSNEIASFQLGSTTDYLNNGRFDQAALDPQTGALYVMETNDSDSRIWIVDAPASVAEGGRVAMRTLANDGASDTGGSGLAVAPGGTLYAFFDGGGTIYDAAKAPFNGARLRSTTSPTPFTHSARVLIGTGTKLSKYGAMAYDYGNNRLFVSRHLLEAQTTGAPILIFTPSQFLLSFNQAPTATLGTESTDLIRIISHAGRKDWLTAANMVNGNASSTIHIWRDPLGTATLKTFSAGTGVAIKGIGLDGSN